MKTYTIGTLYETFGTTNNKSKAISICNMICERRRISPSVYSEDDFGFRSEIGHAEYCKAQKGARFIKEG